MKLRYPIGILTGVLFVASCAKSNEAPSTQTSPVREASPVATQSSTGGGSTIAVAHGGSERVSDSTPVTSAEGGPQGAGGLTWTQPRRWSVGPERSMRAATYIVPGVSGEAEDGECAVFFFGPGQGGGVEANIERWVGQFEQPDGKPSLERAKRETETISGMSVAMVDLTGTYTGGGPAMGASGGSKSGYRLLGAIVSGPQAGVFFKLTGPVKTVAAAEKEFRSMLASIR